MKIGDLVRLKESTFLWTTDGIVADGPTSKNNTVGVVVSISKDKKSVSVLYKGSVLEITASVLDYL